MEDNCVYARNLLGRLISTYGSSTTQTYSSSQTPSSGISDPIVDNFITPGTLMMIGAVLMLLFFSLKNRKKTGQSKI